MEEAKVTRDVQDSEGHGMTLAKQKAEPTWSNQRRDQGINHSRVNRLIKLQVNKTRKAAVKKKEDY